MKKALSSFAMIKNSFDEGEDYIGAFVPLVILLFEARNYQMVDIETICKDFENEYGLRVPRHPMETILNRMKPQFVSRTNGKIRANQNEIRRRAETIDFFQEKQKYDWLLENFINFCHNFQTPIEITKEEADELFLAFLIEHDIDVVFAIYGDEKLSILSAEAEFTEPDKRYLTNRYVNWLMQEGGEHAKYLIDIAVGHNYASTILYREFANLSGKGVCKNYYFDVGILFDIAGVNNSFRKKAAEDFLAMLKDKGSSLFVFRHNYDEFMQIIENCLNWIESNYYDPNKASRTLLFFKDEGYSAADLQLFISRIPDVLKRYHIEVVNTPDPNFDQGYQISREDLKRIILETYNSDGFYFDLEEKEDTLERDITSIESIYKLRRGMAPTNLNNTSHVFVTTNAGLAYASTIFEHTEIKRGYFTIPAALTDTFVGTVVWVQGPTGIVEEYNKSKLITYTAAAIHPKANLMVKFAHVVERAKKDDFNPISEESASMLLEANISRRLLADKTLGDSSRITASTPYEVLEETKSYLVKQERLRTSQANQSLEIEKKEKERIAGEFSNQTANIKKIIETISVWGRRFVVSILFIVAASLFAITEFSESKPMVVKIINYVIAVASFCSGVSAVTFSKKIEIFIRARLTNIFLRV